jgi:hypothetical protein
MYRHKQRLLLNPSVFGNFTSKSVSCLISDLSLSSLSPETDCPGKGPVRAVLFTLYVTFLSHSSYICLFSVDSKRYNSNELGAVSFEVVVTII